LKNLGEPSRDLREGKAGGLPSGDPGLLTDFDGIKAFFVLDDAIGD
jgi:hypothetical protein